MRNYSKLQKKRRSQKSMRPSSPEPPANPPPGLFREEAMAASLNRSAGAVVLSRWLWLWLWQWQWQSFFLWHWAAARGVRR